MRIKALLCAAVFAAGIATSLADNVYSLNVVGYYNITIPAGKQAFIANQLNTTNNTLGALLPSVPVNSVFYKYTTGSGYTLYQFDEFDLVWTPDGNATLNPGEGGIFKNVTASPLTLTFVGEVLQGSLSNGIPAGFAIRSSQVPQAGEVAGVLGFSNGAPNDVIYQYNPAAGFTLYQFDEFDLVWTPLNANNNNLGPILSVGEAAFFNLTSQRAWTRSFTVQ